MRVLRISCLVTCLATAACAGAKLPFGKRSVESADAAAGEEAAAPDVPTEQPAAASDELALPFITRPDGTIDYPKLYCESVGKLPLRVGIADELSALCENGQPSELLLRYRAEALARETGEFEIRILEEKVTPETEQSEFRMMWSFFVGSRPFNVKASPIYDHITVPYSSELLELQTDVAVRADDPLDSGLHLWSVDIGYDLALNAAPNLILEANRKTQYNLYQVQSGNEEMGFALEHLVEVDPESFSKYISLTIAFNDGTGFNDGRGGTVLVGLLHLQVNNPGLPALARDAALEVTQHAIGGLSAALRTAP
jgi:hypothetical protein